MTLVLKNEQIDGILPMSQNIQAIEEAFYELGRGVAMNRPRSRIYIESDTPDTFFFLNIIAGAVPGINTVAVRIDSSLSRNVVVNGTPRLQGLGDFTGFIMIFDIKTCKLLAIVDDHYVSTMRVAGTSGVAAKYLARENAHVMGLFGTGEQARTQLLAMCAVRRIDKVKVYSPNKEHRDSFALKMGQVLGTEIAAVDDPLKVVEGSDIVVTATGAVDPVFNGEWLEEGTHVSTVVGGDYMLKRDEIDYSTYRRSEVIIVTSREQIEIDRQGNIYELLHSGELSLESLPELSELLVGKAKGRTSDKQITLFKNNTGTGVQFAATTNRIYKMAVERGLGTELPTELFTTQRTGTWVP
jgi:alanine dehydrogenase